MSKKSSQTTSSSALTVETQQRLICHNNLSSLQNYNLVALRPSNIKRQRFDNQEKLQIF